MVLGRSTRPILPEHLNRLLGDRARTFSLAARLLPTDRRAATTVVYAFCRVADDLADEPLDGLSREDRLTRLSEWRAFLHRERAPLGDKDLARALRAVISQYNIPTEYFLALLDGLEGDLDRVRMASFDELALYCRRVAGTVGLAMCHVLGTSAPAALAAATDLGIAMQLTNILRDIGGDLENDRVYLPADEMARYRYSTERLFAAHERRERPDADLQAFLAAQVVRARAYYDRGLAGVWLLPPDVRPAILLAGRLYRAILDVIEESGYDVLRQRAVTSRFRKGREAATALLIHRLWGGQGRVGAVFPLLEEETTPQLAWLKASRPAASLSAVSSSFGGGR